MLCDDALHPLLEEIMKRTDRIGAMIKILSDTPGKMFPLSYFCDLFHAAKSSISEDITIAARMISEQELGRITTTPGTGGGVKYVPFPSDRQCLEIQQELCDRLSDPSRILGGGFLYTSDIMFDPHFVPKMASVFARNFAQSEAHCVTTVETKGIPLAMAVAGFLDIPVVIVRRESKISEGPTLSINYFSGSTGKMQKMSMAKKAVAGCKQGSKAIVIDDFMRAGGSLKGIAELLEEFHIRVCNIGVAISYAEPEIKKVSDYISLVQLVSVDETERKISVEPSLHLRPCSKQIL